MTSTNDIEAGMAAAREREAARQVEERAALLERLRAAGMTRIVAHYDGYGDSGDVSEITGGMDDDLEDAVSGFAWDFAYSRHPGFENGQGGQGVFTWDIEADSITLDHGDNYVEVDRTVEEGL